jgi:hypothetical protein
MSGELRRALVGRSTAAECRITWLGYRRATDEMQAMLWRTHMDCVRLRPEIVALRARVAALRYSYQSGIAAGFPEAQLRFMRAELESIEEELHRIEKKARLL